MREVYISFRQWKEDGARGYNDGDEEEEPKY